MLKVKEARPETRSSVRANREALASHLLSSAGKTKTRRWRVKIDIRDQRAIYPDESPLKIFKSLLRINGR